MTSHYWYSRPLFISSTFKDMQAERDYLRDMVFPELESRLRERFGHLEPIDLRWGIETVTTEEQEQKELLVLKVCLGEIERSRPFLIVLLGDRCGWIPPQKRMQSAIDEKAYNTDIIGKSVTALEIEYGILNTAEHKTRSFFYFRESLPYGEMPKSIAALYSDEYSDTPSAQEAHERLVAVKVDIEQNPLTKDHVRHYQVKWINNRVSGLEVFGNQVLKDLWQVLDEDTKDRAKEIDPSWQGQERRSLEEFIELRSINFAGRETLVEEIYNIATSKIGS